MKNKEMTKDAKQTLTVVIVVGILFTLIMCAMSAYVFFKDGGFNQVKPTATIEYCPLDKTFRENDIIMDFVYEFKDIAQSVLDNPRSISLYVTDAELLADKINKQEVSPCLEPLKLALYNAVSSFQKSIFYLSIGDTVNYEKYLDISSDYIDQMHKELKIYENEVDK